MMIILPEQEERLKKVLRQVICSNASTGKPYDLYQQCMHSFIPEEDIGQKALNLYQELFGEGESHE
jgi:hypothetical protein